MRAPIVIKLGGRALEGRMTVGEFAADVAALSEAPILVHGGGAEVSSWCERVGLEPRFLDGLRVTDPATLEVAVAVLAGLANKRLVAAARAAGLDAVGLAALDGGIARVARHPRAACLGAVGTITRIMPDLLGGLLAEGRTPVLASIGAQDGALLNLNADDLAASMAAAFPAEMLVLLSDAPGLILDGAVVPRMDVEGLEAAMSHPGVGGGMIPKLGAARTALAAGVGKVTIGAWSGPGTLARLLAGQQGTTLVPGAVAVVEGGHD